MMTNYELVEFCEKALEEKWGYVWGTFGQILTPSRFRQKLRQYPINAGIYESFIRSNWLGKQTVDCVGLIKGALWNVNGKIKYSPSTDINANDMILRCAESGPIDSIPNIPGLLVWKRGHIGVYVGDGQVIEAHGTKHGVIKTPVIGEGATGWTKWGKSKYFDYDCLSKWAKEGHNFVTENHISDGLRPKNAVTREEVWTMLKNYHDLSLK